MRGRGDRYTRRLSVTARAGEGVQSPLREDGDVDASRGWLAARWLKALHVWVVSIDRQHTDLLAREAPLRKHIWKYG